MKKIIYVCLLAVLAVSFGCEKDEISTTDAQQEVESKSVLNSENIKDLNFNQNSYGGKKAQEKSSVSLNCDYNITNTLYPIPPNTLTLDVYLNMDELENIFNRNAGNPNISGPFNIFYFNHWKSSFKIYSITYSCVSCKDKIEKWVVNKIEYEAFQNAPILRTDGTNATSVRPRPVPIRNDSDEPTSPPIEIGLNNYWNCFS